MDDTKLILEFMSSHELMVISSLNDKGNPQSAVVGFGHTDKMELIFGTSNKSRKLNNIANNPNVSAVIGWDRGGTLQFEGIAQILSGEDSIKYSEMYFAKNPTARKFRKDPDEVYVLVKPQWIRFTEVTTNPWTIHEIQF
jgi:pyridoxine/pyridoxamine 5'-phosphate oxidase